MLTPPVQFEWRGFARERSQDFPVIFFRFTDAHVYTTPRYLVSSSIRPPRPKFGSGHWAFDGSRDRSDDFSFPRVVRVQQHLRHIDFADARSFSSADPGQVIYPTTVVTTIFYEKPSPIQAFMVQISTGRPQNTTNAN